MILHHPTRRCWRSAQIAAAVYGYPPAVAARAHRTAWARYAGHETVTADLWVAVMPTELEIAARAERAERAKDRER